MNNNPTIIKKLVDFPIYSVDFTTDDRLIVSGGGGPDYAGLKNYLTSFNIDTKTGEMTQEYSLLLSEKEDSPMSIACHPSLPLLAAGINSTTEDIKAGNNENLKLYKTNDNKIELKNKYTTSICKDPKQYQKVTRFSRSGNYLVTVFSDNVVSVLDTKNWKLLFPAVRLKNLQDADFDINEKHLAVATSNALIIFDIDSGVVTQVIDNPKLNKNTECEIRACRYGVNKRGDQRLYAIVNPVTRGRGFICSWKLRKRGNQYPVTKANIAGVSRKAITSFTIDPTGEILAYATTDLCVGFIDAEQLKPLLKLKKVNEFSIDNLKFNHNGNLLAIAGADLHLKVITVPEFKKQQESTLGTTLYMFLDMLLFAFLMDIIVKMMDQGTL